MVWHGIRLSLSSQANRKLAKSHKSFQGSLESDVNGSDMTTATTATTIKTKTKTTTTGLLSRLSQTQTATKTANAKAANNVVVDLDDSSGGESDADSDNHMDTIVDTDPVAELGAVCCDAFLLQRLARTVWSNAASSPLPHDNDQASKTNNGCPNEDPSSLCSPALLQCAVTSFEVRLSVHSFGVLRVKGFALVVVDA